MKIKNFLGLIRFLFLLLIFSSTAHAQNESKRDFENLRFETLDAIAGNSYGQIAAVTVGPSGFVWFGTSRGVHKFDGYSIRSYVHEEGNADSLIHNTVRSLFLDSEKRLWVGTQKGISRFDPKTNAFRNYVLNPNDMNHNLFNRCNAFVEGDDSSIYALSQGGFVYRYEKESDSFFAQNAMSMGVTRSMALGEHGELWIGSDSVLLSFDPQSKKIRTFPNYLGALEKPAKNFLYSLHFDENKQLWIATSGVGLIRFDPVHGVSTRIEPPNERANRITSIFNDQNGNLWVTHLGGLSRYSDGGETVQHYFAEKREDSLPSGGLRCIVIDQQENLWVGANSGLHFSPNNKQFRTIVPDVDELKPGIKSVISSLMLDDQGNYWVGFYYSGIHVYDSDWNLKFELQHDPNDSASIGRYGVHAIYQDAKGDIWVGTFNGGLQLFDPQTRTFRKFFHDPDDATSISGNDIRSIDSDEYGNLWMAIKGGGACFYNRKTESFLTFKTDPLNTDHSILDNWPSDILYGSDKKVYIATPIGLSVYDTTRDEIVNYTRRDSDPYSLSNAACNVLFEDSHHDIWVGTDDGINRLSKDGGFSLKYTIEDGLPGQNVMSVLEDDKGNLWVGTDNGLAKIKISSGAIKSYDVMDGIAHNEFSRGAAFKTGNGFLNFGQSSGITYFDPAAIKDNTLIPAVFVKDIRVFFNSLEIEPDRTDGYGLTRSVMESSVVRLKHQQKVVSIEYVAQNFIQSSKNQYAYKLEGFDDDWNYVGSRREANYTNLNPGKYTFKVKASNNDGYWNEVGAELDLIVTPPFWLQTWFIVLVGVCLIGLLYLFIVFREYRLKQDKLRLESEVRERTQMVYDQNVELEAQKDELQKHRDRLEFMVKERTSELLGAKERAEESDRLKSSFIANLSHEIRTPLNAIVGFTSLINDDSVSSDDRNTWEKIIKDSSDSLIGLIEDIMDFSMMESNQLKINESLFDLNDFIDHFEAKHGLTAEPLNFEYRVENGVDDLRYRLNSDSLRIRQIVDNLITNAFKFTEQGSVVLRVYSDDEWLRFAVTDTGKGIKDENQEAVFQQFLKLREDEMSAKPGVGLGLAISRRLAGLLGGELSLESEYMKGSTFTFKIPLSKCTQASDTSSSNISHHAIVRENEIPRILVIDDEVLNYQFIESALRKFDVKTIWVDNGDDAVKRYREDVFDLVLLDIKMPGKSGYDVIKEIREINPDSVVVAQTAYAMSDDLVRYEDAGFSEVLTKPIPTAALEKVIRKFLDL